MHRLLSVSLLLPLWLSAAAYARIDLLPASPRIVNQSEEDLIDTTSSGIPVVEIGGKVYLQASANIPGVSLDQIAWSFAARPSGSEPSTFVQGGELFAFIPDVEGVYEVELSAMQGAASLTETIRIVAGTYDGVGNLNGGRPEFPACALCHDANAATWLDTAHAGALRFHMNGMRTDQYDGSCLECHTLGYAPGQLPPDGGFDDALAASDLTAADIADQVETAYQLNNDRDPDNDVDFYNQLEPDVRAMANVQCESCHGPGSQHLGNTQNIFKPWNAHSCAECHDAQGFDGHPYSYDSSGHPVLKGAFAQAPALLTSACAKCHSANGFVTLAVEGGQPADIDASIEPHGVTCVACHDPHEAANPHQLRVHDDVTLESGFEFNNAGTGAICAECHQSRVNTDLASFIESNPAGPHYGPQADVMLGVNAWDYGQGFVTETSIHKYAVQDSCAACHMAHSPAEGGWTPERGTVLGGHSFALVDSETAADNHRNACLSCHLTITGIDRLLPETGEDYDGDGVREGIQSEISGLMAVVASRLQERQPGVEINDDGSLTVSSNLYRQMSFDEKAAVYNYRLLRLDGSMGIHNPRFAVEVLQKTYGALAGVEFADAFPRAYSVGPVGVSDWPAHE